MMGVFDLNNRAVISCTYKSIQYIGCGVYLCEGFENGPGTRLEKLTFVPFSSLPERVRKDAQRLGSKTPKTLRDKFGNLLKPSLPTKTTLIDVFIPEKTRNAYLRDKNKTVAAGLPNDTLLAIAGVNGMGLCDLQGNVLIEPKYPALVIGGADSGNVTGFQWNEEKNKFVQSQIPIPNRGTAASSSDLKKVNDVHASMQKPYEGMVVYRNSDGLYGYTDEQGKIVIDAKYYWPGHFSGGVAAVRLNPWHGPDKGRYCFIDKTGKIVSPIFWRIWGFYGDYALVSEKGGESTLGGNYRSDLYGIIDRNYNYVVPLAPRLIRYLPAGFWVIGNGSEPAVVLNRQGKEVFRTPERASLCNASDDTHIFMTTSGGKRRLLYYDKDWNLINEVEGDPGQHSMNPLILTKGSTVGYDVQSAVVDDRGNFTIAYENALFRFAESDRFIKTVFGTTFVKEDWDIPNRNRGREFQLFVREYKLIGLKRSEVERLLGPGSQKGPGTNVFYTISGFGSWCGNAYESVEIEYVADVVSRWRYTSFGSDNVWKN